MATVKEVLTCVCAGRERTSADSVYFGMPQIKVSNSIRPHKQFWSAYCPNCGRGGLMEEPSAYKALKQWNALQENLKHTEFTFNNNNEGGNPNG